MHRPFMLVLLALLPFCIAGCGGGSSSGSQSNQGGPPQSNGTSVVVTPTTAMVYQGMTTQFQAQVVGQNNQTVTWSVEQHGWGTIDSTGLYTAPRDASGGPFHVVATSQAAPTARGSAAVTVLVPEVIVAPAGVTLAPGETQTFTATVGGLADSNVTWTVQEADGGSVSDNGFYTAPANTGFFHVVATSIADTTFNGSAGITVTTATGRFSSTGNMVTARGFHTATLLPNGKVLMAGGAYHTNRSDFIPCFGGMSSAEMYDPLTGSFTVTANMTHPRYNHAATLLMTGQVLLTGGIGVISGLPDCDDGGNPPVWRSADLYDPSHGSFAATGDMTVQREGHTATLLPGGNVLVAGGVNENFVGIDAAEIYDPHAGTFSSTGYMSIPRSGHTATVLVNGKVLIAGGMESGSQPFSGVATAKAEIFDPRTGSFSPTSNMTAARAGHTATLLATGLVLIVGGSDSSTAELYDPASGTFSLTGDMGQAGGSHTATLLSNGTVLITNGADSTAEIYDPSTGRFSPTGDIGAGLSGRSGYKATVLQNGKVLVSGGKQGSSLFLATAELYK